MDCTRKALIRRFKEYGAVESCRFRSFSVNNPKVPKKAALIRHAFHPQRQTMNAYVVYEEEEAVTKALQANGTQFMDLTLRCDYADPNKRQPSPSSSPPALSHPRQTLFVGNLPFSASEEALLSLFTDAGAIRYVRLVRDSQMNVGKGFGFVVFEEESAVKKALAMSGVALEGRVLRLSRGLDDVKLKQMRETREKERMREEGLVGAARRVAGKEKKEKHAKRKAAAALLQGPPLPPPSVKGRTPSASSKKATAAAPSTKPTSYGGERSDPQEWVRKQRRLEKKKKQKKEERKHKHSLVRTKTKKPKPSTATTKKAAA